MVYKLGNLSSQKKKHLSSLLTMKYIVNGETLHHTGHNGLKEVYYFTRPTKEKNELVEIPFTFDGIIFKEEEKKVQ